ncbi:myosin-H heavy chain-like, partial [Trifolium medium]|nr:myosin-H heavy chain-like [Trifolium medium]
GMQREASSLLIQRYFRMHIARKAYKDLYASAVSIQTGMRVMAASRELHFRRRTSAAIVIQVGDTLKSVYIR